MAFVQDEELLQDFLVEAGELLEQLSEQLVELEQDAQDAELLNAIFRAFHTIKGGAGFLEIKTLVDVCHCAEDVFDALRQGRRDVDAHLMDVILRAYDSLLEQMSDIRDGNEPEPVDTDLIAQLEQLLHEDAPAAGSVTDTSVVAEAIQGESDEPDEPVDVVSAADTASVVEVPSAEPAAPSAEGEFSDDDFEALLDNLHGGAIPGAVRSEAEVETETPSASVTTDSTNSSVSWDYIPEAGDC